MKGIKHDAGKPVFSCLDPRSMLDLGAVGAFGKAKYGQMNWLEVEDGESRYWDAAARHLFQAQLEWADKETGLPHLAHAAWNCLAALTFRRPSGEK